MPILLHTQQNQVGQITLNRPEVHNALNDVLIEELTRTFTDLSKDDRVRAILLTGSGPSFCAGGDLNWLKKTADSSQEETVQDAKKLHRMLLSIYRCPKPVLAKIHGAVMGGGVGLVSAVDIAFADPAATFALSEARLGLVPAVISPFVIQKIGASRFREYALTAERLSASQAKEIGLIQYCGTPEEIDRLIEAKITLLKSGGPEALAKVKELTTKVLHTDFEAVEEITAGLLAERRASAEAEEGINAFLKKQKPNWVS